jgi:hypothetical protein
VGRLGAPSAVWLTPGLHSRDRRPAVRVIRMPPSFACEPNSPRTAWQTLSIEPDADHPAMKRVAQKRGNSLLLPPNQLGAGRPRVAARRPPGGEWITVGVDLELSFTQARRPVAGAVSWPFSPLAGSTAPAGKTTAPAFSICLVTESINSSQLLAKDAMPCSSRMLRPLQCSLLPGSRSRTWRVLQ